MVRTNRVKLSASSPFTIIVILSSLIIILLGVALFFNASSLIEKSEGRGPGAGYGAAIVATVYFFVWVIVLLAVPTLFFTKYFIKNGQFKSSAKLKSKKITHSGDISFSQIGKVFLLSSVFLIVLGVLLFNQSPIEIIKGYISGFPGSLLFHLIATTVISLPSLIFLSIRNRRK